jgi:uroporphyrin-III C-methyltransferase/precorrin-2 dehydrogenase/sirohydrochlorin ferrochelatase
VIVHSTMGATSAGRMAPLARLPVFFALDGKPAIVAGGSAAAAWKAELLSAAGARVEVYAEELSEDMRRIAADPPRGPIVLHARNWTAGDLAGNAIAVGAFEADADAAAFAAVARKCGVPVNVIDKPAFCDFAFGAIVNRSPLVIGISTDGAAPVFAQAIRAKLETLLPRGFSLWAAAAQSWRPAVGASVLTSAARRKFWQLFAARAVIHAGRDPAQADFERLLAEVQEYGAAVENGSVTFVTANSGDPQLLTLRAVRVLQSADVILFDEFVPGGILDFARREARKLLVQKTGSEDDSRALMAALARRGKHVVRLIAGADEGAASVREVAVSDLSAVSVPGAAKSSAGRSGAVA